jgi:hypothetical protein
MVILLTDKWPRRAPGLGSHSRRLWEVAGGYAGVERRCGYVGGCRHGSRESEYQAGSTAGRAGTDMSM